MTKTALILGSNGRFGRNAAAAFETAGWTVRRFDRALDTLEQAVRGVDVVVNGWNPPDYSTWARDLLPMHHKVIKALKGSNATVIIPGNVYVFGAQIGAPWGPDTPQKPVNSLGQLRVRMEADYRASGVRTIILRAGDFLDTEPTGNWFDKVMVTKLNKGVFTYPGDPDAPHAWAYLPDLTRAAVLFADRRDDLPDFLDVSFPGYTLSGAQIAALLGGDVTLKRMAWWPLRLLAPVWPMLRGLVQMRYLWDTPHSLDGRTFDSLLPGFQHTPAEQALHMATRHVDRKRSGSAGQVLQSAR